MRVLSCKRTVTRALQKAIERGNYAVVKQLIMKDEYLINRNFSPYIADYPVHVAIYTGRRRILKLLLNHGADPNVKNTNQQSAAHVCVLLRKHDLLHLLMIYGADPGALDSSNNTVLEQCMLMNRKLCLNVLLSCNVPISVLNKAFFQANMLNDNILMNRLLIRGADIDYKDVDTGYTALLAAAKYGNLNIVQFLLAKGANPGVYEKSGWTCLHFAVYLQFPVEVLHLILEKITIDKNIIDFQTSEMETAMHLAAYKDNFVAVSMLLKFGANINLLDAESRTPLLTALDNRNYSMVEFIVMAGAELNWIPGSTRVPPLHCIVPYNCVTIVQLLLLSGAIVVDMQNDDLDWTVIHMACENGNEHMLEILLKYIDLDVLIALHENGRMCPPIIVAAMMSHWSLVDILLDCGVNVNTKCDNGETILHKAIRLNNPAVVVKLLDLGAFIDSKIGVAGNRPLDVSLYTWGRDVAITSHLIHSNRLAKAVIQSDLTTVNFLLSCGMSPNITTEEYGSLLHLAIRYRQYHLIVILLSSNECRTNIRYNGLTPYEYALSFDDIFTSGLIQRREQNDWRDQFWALFVGIHKPSETIGNVGNDSDSTIGR